MTAETTIDPTTAATTAPSEFDLGAWCKVPRRGAVVARMLPFKCPIDAMSLDHHKVDDEFVFTPGMAISGKDVRLVVNLSPHSTYDTAFWESKGITYLHFPVTSDHEPIPEKTLSIVLKCIESALNKFPQSLIALHDTFSYNITGLIICEYLVSVVGYGVSAALEEFRRSRPPGVYSRQMIDSLYKKYDETMPLALKYPDVPDFDQRYKEFDKSRRMANDAFKAPSLPSRKRPAETDAASSEPIKKAALDPHPVPHHSRHLGVRVKSPHLERLVNELSKLCQVDNTCQFRPYLRDNTSLSKDSLPGQDAYVTWKGVGIPHTLFIIHEGAFVYTPNRELFHVKMNLPKRGTNPPVQIKDVVIQGEVFVGKDQRDDEFHVSDILVFEKKLLYQSMNFIERQELLRNEIMEPREHAVKSADAFKMEMKLSVPIADIEELVLAIPSLKHRPESLLFVPRQMSEKVIEWVKGAEAEWASIKDLIIS